MLLVHSAQVMDPINKKNNGKKLFILIYSSAFWLWTLAQK